LSLTNIGAKCNVLDESCFVEFTLFLNLFKLFITVHKPAVFAYGF